MSIIARLATKLPNFCRFGSKTREFGKLIGKTENGIKVFEKTGKDGERILTSFKDGEKFKTVTNRKYQGIEFGEHISGNRITSVNHETGLTTQVEKYTNFAVDRNKKFNTFHRESYYPDEHGQRRTYEVLHHIKTKPFVPDYRYERYSRTIGDSFYRKDFTQAGCDRTLHLAAVNYQMPNGQRLTGQWGREWRYSPIQDKVLSRNLDSGRTHSFYKDNNGVLNQELLHWDSAFHVGNLEKGGAKFV